MKISEVREERNQVLHRFHASEEVAWVHFKERKSNDEITRMFLTLSVKRWDNANED
jgi:hypothetical protein